MLSPMTQPLGVGDFVAWDGGCLLIGQAHRETGMHSHYAIQFSFGLVDGIRFRPNESVPWAAYDGVVIASRQPHAMDATTVGRSATMLIETETPQGRALAEMFPSDGISSLERKRFASAAEALFSTWERHRHGDETAKAARNAIHSVTGDLEPSAMSDERILKAVAYINEHLDGPLTLTEIAKQAFLSPTRFRHVFVDQTGTALRPYVLWRRFLRSWELIRGGASISTAAHAAGFADAAHLTRTSQRMFGFAPSALLVRAGADSPATSPPSIKTPKEHR
jgi:AraC family transcriptional regulator